MKKTRIVELYIRNLTFFLFIFDSIDYYNFLSCMLLSLRKHNDNYINIIFSLSTVRDTELFV